MKLFLFVLLFPLFAFSEEFSDTEWRVSGAGCMDGSFSSSSYRSKPTSSADMGQINVKFINNAVAVATLSAGKETKTIRGAYKINDDQLDIQGADRLLYIRGNSLVVRGNSVESMEQCCPHNITLWYNWREVKEREEGLGGWEEHKKEHNIETEDEWFAETLEEHRELRYKCMADHPFVYILRKV